MRILRVAALMMSISTAVSVTADEPPVRLELACQGAGSANKSDSATINAYGDYGSGSAQIIGRRSEGFADQVNLWVEAADGRIRMPRVMLPPLRGGEDGWFKLKSIELTAREITASVAINPLNNPKLRIDRYTGAISISGKAGHFNGRCIRYDPATEQRAF